MKASKSVAKRQAKKVTFKKVTMKNALNAPKINGALQGCMNIASIAGTSDVGSFTALGHKSGMGAVVDHVILNGTGTTLQAFINAIMNSDLTVVQNHRAKYTYATCEAIFAHRVADHLTWCSEAHNLQYGGLIKRLKNVNLENSHREIAGNFELIASTCKAGFKVIYTSLFKARNKTGLLA